MSIYALQKEFIYGVKSLGWLIFHDYLYQPLNVTVNNIYKEFPTISEIVLMASIKAEAITLAYKIFPNVVPGLLANPYFGSFFTDLIKGTQSLVAWSLGLKHGTHEYEIHRPLADILKGICKISLLTSVNTYARDSICEIPARTFLDAMDIMETEQLNRTDYKSWLNVMNHKEFWIDVVREAELKILAAKTTAEYIVRPFVQFITPYTNESFNDVGLMQLYNNLNVMQWLGPIPLAPFSSWIREVFTSAVIIPLTRIMVYEKTNEKILWEHDHGYGCERFLKVYEVADRYKIEIKYKYDVTYINCSLPINKNTTQESDDTIIIHYLEKEDLVGNLMHGVNWIAELVRNYTGIELGKDEL